MPKQESVFLNFSQHSAREEITGSHIWTGRENVSYERIDSSLKIVFSINFNFEVAWAWPGDAKIINFFNHKSSSNVIKINSILSTYIIKIVIKSVYIWVKSQESLN